mgnify:CR=1 FL=1
MKRLLLALVMLVSTSAFAWEHKDINPDTLNELFLESDLVQCYETIPCRYIDNGNIYTPPEGVIPLPGLHIVFPDRYSDELIDQYTPELIELYKGLIDKTNQAVLPPDKKE